MSRAARTTYHPDLLQACGDSVVDCGTKLSQGAFHVRGAARPDSAAIGNLVDADHGLVGAAVDFNTRFAAFVAGQAASFPQSEFDVLVDRLRRHVKEVQSWAVEEPLPAEVELSLVRLTLSQWSVHYPLVAEFKLPNGLPAP